MASMAEVRQGISDALSTIPDMQASAYMMANPTPPSAHVFPDEIDYDKTFQRGHDDWFMTVQAFVATASDIGSQQRLDEMLAPSGDYSVKEAIESDSTLGGVIDDLRVVSCTGYRIYPVDSGRHYLGAEWRVQIIE